MNIRRGNVVLAKLDPVKGSEQGKTRPCLVIQNDVGNKMSPTTIIAAITSKTEREYPFMVRLSTGEGGLKKEGLVLCNQLRTISIEDRIISKIGSLKKGTMDKVDEALRTSLSL